MLHQMRVKGLIADPVTQTPVVLLAGVDSEQELQIWIGTNEANAIAVEIENIKVPRPMTHDLLKSVIQELDATVVRVIVTELKSDTFYAAIELYHDGETSVIDSRPSDALALALRTNAPIFVNEEVLRADGKTANNLPAVQDDSQKEASGESWKDDDESIKQWLDNISPEDF